MQCFNIYNSYAPWNARPLLLLYYFIQKRVSFVLLNWKLRFVKGMSLLWVYFKFKTVILCYLDSVSDDWLMVTIPPVFQASFLGKRVVKKFKFWWLTYWHFVLLKKKFRILSYTTLKIPTRDLISANLTQYFLSRRACWLPKWSVQRSRKALRCVNDWIELHVKYLTFINIVNNVANMRAEHISVYLMNWDKHDRTGCT